jgi:hypothetical protein
MLNKSDKQLITQLLDRERERLYYDYIDPKRKNDKVLRDRYEHIEQLIDKLKNL